MANPIFALYANTPEKHRADGKNFILVSAPTAAQAPAAARALAPNTADADAFTNYLIVTIWDGTAGNAGGQMGNGVIVESEAAVGPALVWSSIGKGGGKH